MEGCTRGVYIAGLPTGFRLFLRFLTFLAFLTFSYGYGDGLTALRPYGLTRLELDCFLGTEERCGIKGDVSRKRKRKRRSETAEKYVRNTLLQRSGKAR